MKDHPRIAYADAFSGISGDMFLGALLHCGLDEEALRGVLARLPMDPPRLQVDRTTSCGIAAVKVEVDCSGAAPLRHLSDIRTILEKAELDEPVRERALAVFAEIARAEAKVHGIAVERVHFHEVGAVDTIVDVVGVIAGLHLLGVTELHASPLPQPRGFVDCAHGRLPLPAPAVCEILAGIPCYGVEQQCELVTPTGAALLKVLASGFGPQPPMNLQASGYGAGTHELDNRQPNLFRLLLGEALHPLEEQDVEVLETHLDDWQAEGFPHLSARLLGAGALDVSLTPMLMKKGRPGYDLQVLAPPHAAPELRRLIFSETSSIGIRFRREARQTLPRQTVEVITPWGPLAAKQVETPDGVRIYPEYEACRKVAEEHGVPLQAVYDEVRRSPAP